VNQPPPILLVSPQAHYPSHYWVYTLALMEALRQKGQDVQAVVFSQDAAGIPAEQRASVRAVFSRLPFPWNRIAMDRWQQSRYLRRLFLVETCLCLAKALQLARRHPGSVVHFLGGSLWPLLLAVPRCRQHRFFYTIYGNMVLNTASAGQRRLGRAMSKALATGRLDFICETELVRDELALLAGPHAHWVPGAIDDREALPTQAEARQQLGLPADQKIVLFFGTHRQGKDYHTALKGCLALADPPLALFVGKVISTNDPKQVIAELRYPNARVVDEFIPEPMTKYYFAAADAVVLPYQTGFSRGSGVLIDGCRHLRPMIVSDTPFFSAFLARYHCGAGYAPGDSASFAQAAGKLLANCAAYDRGLRQARDDHSWRGLVGRYITLYASGKP
jgi:glycosyltransferase involved in cell wall biosynthesis